MRLNVDGLEFWNSLSRFNHICRVWECSACTVLQKEPGSRGSCAASECQKSIIDEFVCPEVHPPPDFVHPRSCGQAVAGGCSEDTRAWPRSRCLFTSQQDSVDLSPVMDHLLLLPLTAWEQRPWNLGAFSSWDNSLHDGVTFLPRWFSRWRDKSCLSLLLPHCLHHPIKKISSGKSSDIQHKQSLSPAFKS